MLDEISVLQQAALDVGELPNSSQVISALLKLEKETKTKETGNEDYSLTNLAGTWNLRFITGTKKTRKRAGVILGSGKYIPRLIKIQIMYQAREPESAKGKVVNSVGLGFLQLSLTGPIEFISKKSILAFDFTNLKFSVGNLVLYQGQIKSKASTEADFWQQKLKDRAFFKYFVIEDSLIAARGKGGGLALWTRE
ncbi:MAG: hypothetical protein AAF652_17215 [Cyanobacteria bacterium P01_C01_bin.72]